MSLLIGCSPSIKYELSTTIPERFSLGDTKRTSKSLRGEYEAIEIELAMNKKLSRADKKRLEIRQEVLTRLATMNGLGTSTFWKGKIRKQKNGRT
jgi:hypothetical protein